MGRSLKQKRKPSYQDTHKNVVEIFVDKVSEDGKTTIGFFGDSMQGIYDDGAGDVESYINSGQLTKINKEDNYRCSEDVITFINQIRNDGLEQKLAFKTKNGLTETGEERQGEVKLYYSIYSEELKLKIQIQKCRQNLNNHKLFYQLYI